MCVSIHLSDCVEDAVRKRQMTMQRQDACHCRLVFFVVVVRDSCSFCSRNCHAKGQMTDGAAHLALKIAPVACRWQRAQEVGHASAVPAHDVFTIFHSLAKMWIGFGE